ncbi:MAG: outer membrane protein transport protein [Pseudomonadota bacterium]
MSGMKQPVLKRGLPGSRTLALVVAALATLPVHAAELGRIEGFGPISRAMAGAGVAHPHGAAAMMLNPAELLRLDSPQEWLVQITGIHARIEVFNRDTGERVQSANNNDNRGPYYLPEVAFAARRGRWAFGAGVFGAGGFGIEFGNESFLSRTSTFGVQTGLPVNTRVQLLRIPFSLAWQAHPQWRLGASLDVVNASVNIASLLDVQQVGMLIANGRASGSLVPVLAGVPDLAGAHLDFVRNNVVSSRLNGWGLGGRLGLSHTPAPGTDLALAYEFETRLDDLQGRGRLTAVDKDNRHIVLAGEGRLPQFQFPQAFVLGVSQRLTPALTGLVDLRRTFWRDTLGDTLVTFRADGGGDLRVSLPTQFNNLTTLTLGLQWQASPTLTARLGGSHAFQNTVAADSLNGSFPTLTRNHLTAGLTWRYRAAHELGATLSYGFTGTVENAGGNSNSIPAIGGDNRQINPAMSYVYRF